VFNCTITLEKMLLPAIIDKINHTPGETMDEHQERILFEFISVLDELDTLIETVTGDQLDWSAKAGE
jgi:hypothetical protein